MVLRHLTGEITAQSKKGTTERTRTMMPSTSGRDLPHGRTAAHLLYSSPEFLFRRAHQIASAGFAEACRHLDLTPSQYSALFMLREVNEVSQNELGRLVALDRSTTSVVLRSLRERRLVREHADPADRRKKRLKLTDSGRLLLAEAERLSTGSSQQLLASLGAEKATLLLSLLEQFSAAAKTEVAD